MTRSPGSATVVPGTMRDSLHVLDTMLNLDAGPKPEMVATDTASYSDIVFGLFRMLGYRFSPRIADLSDQRFWRATPARGAGKRLRAAERPRPAPGEPGADPRALGRHDPRRGVAGHQPGPRL